MLAREEILHGTNEVILNASYSQDYILKAMSTYANQILDEVLSTCFEDLGEGVKHFNKHKLAEIRKKI